jgi:hypothetical protein
MMAEQSMYRFYASSILFIYEGDEEGVVDGDEIDAACTLNVKMIDFGKALSPESDTNSSVFSSWFTWYGCKNALGSHAFQCKEQQKGGFRCLDCLCAIQHQQLFFPCFFHCFLGPAASQHQHSFPSLGF